LIAKRATLGIARTGTIGSSSSGDIFFSFSTAKDDYDKATKTTLSRALSKSSLDPIYRATVEATEEAIINALVAARDMEGINGNKAFAIPHDRLRVIMKKYNR
jgi:L-aminopeptidase/D-esterase-like protein